MALGSILIADDEETFRESTSRLLRREGYDCHCVKDAEEAIDSLRSGRFDVLISDIRMPQNADLRIVGEARELDSHLPVILVTGYPSAETAIQGIELSVAAYLTKPLDFDELLGHVKSAIDRSQNRRARAAVQERLQTCLDDLEAAERLPLSSAEGDDDMVSAGTIRTLAACLSELLRLGGRPGVYADSHNLCELLDCPQQPVHRQAIVETIEVLKKTKDAFKSKALAELRTKLELLLGQD
jgi:DNA-binding response OmpR family regulator